MKKEISKDAISRKKLSVMVDETIEEYKTVENMLAEVAYLDRRSGLIHRTARGFAFFMEEVIFEDDSYQRYDNFKAYDGCGGSDIEALKRWAALYLIETRREVEEEDESDYV